MKVTFNRTGDKPLKASIVSLSEKASLPNIKLLIGLGNPGKDTQKTYHNAGFLFIDYAKTKLPDAGYSFLKTNCFMNESGNFVRKTLKKYKLRPEEILIAHDDSDIEIGRYKLNFGRGSAGHRGVESIIKNLKTKNFWRIRIGIRKKGQKSKASEIVLKKMSAEDMKKLKGCFEELIRFLYKNLN